MRVYFISVIAVAMIFLSCACADGAVDIGELLNYQTVRIQIEHKEGKEVGSGIVLCQKGERIYILTAKHVLIGEGSFDENQKPTGRFRNISTVTIKFYKKYQSDIIKEWSEITEKHASTEDIALLQVKMTDHVSSLKLSTIGTSDNVKLFQEVYTTGHPVSITKDWYPCTGKVNRIGEYIEYTAEIEKGYSGGPVVNQRGELIGMNAHISKSDEGRTIAGAIPVNEILDTLRPWMELSCLQRSIKETTAVRANWFLIDEALKKVCEVTDRNFVFVGDILSARVSLVNKSNKTLHFQYKFSWLDENGIEIDPDSEAWTPSIIYGGETKTLQGVAPNPRAREFKIQIRK